MNIQTSHDRPPIPTRDCDWSAIDQDSYDGADDAHPSCQIIGRGPTEIAAINNLVEQLVEQAETAQARKAASPALKIGQLYRPRRGPWPAKEGAKPVRILDLLDGWVRYYVNEYLPDERETEDIFRRTFPELVAEAEARAA